MQRSDNKGGLPPPKAQLFPGKPNEAKASFLYLFSKT
jgi:hypothetical protein